MSLLLLRRLVADSLNLKLKAPRKSKEEVRMKFTGTFNPYLENESIIFKVANHPLRQIGVVVYMMS